MSTQYPGGFITKSPVAPTSSAASGIWTVDQAMQYQKAGTWPSPPIFIEDLFSTYLFTGNALASQTITNNIDVSGKGGLVWIKSRNVTGSDGNYLQDTARGATSTLVSNSTAAATSGVLSSFTSSGFVQIAGWGTSDLLASWTFAKQPKFFDIVTYTGNNSTGGQTINHNLGSIPGCIIYKAISGTSAVTDWEVYHTSLGSDDVTLNTTNAAQANGFWNTTPTATTFKTAFGVAGRDVTNASGTTYVAYLFASNAGGFPASGSGSTNGITCGSYTGNGSATGPTITLGYEPQWILTKNAITAGYNWNMFDNMRGLPVGSGDLALQANLDNAESSALNWLAPTATGFNVTNTNSQINGSGDTIIYIAIRRGPMKTPTDATTVFAPVAQNAASNAVVSTNFPVDVGINFKRDGGGGAYWLDRLRGGTTTSTIALTSATTAAEYTNASYGIGFANNTAIIDNFTLALIGAGPYVFWNFRRAPGFFDEVCSTGTGATMAINHNLGVTPELMITKRRDVTGQWYVYSATTGATQYLRLQGTFASGTASSVWNDTAPTSTQFTIGNGIQNSAETFVTYLFATCPGVSKVGTYSGTGATQTINCGFSGGARFALIKRTDSTGDWYVWDTARGMVSGTDPSLLLNSTAAEVNANSVYTITTGFQIVSTAAGINASGGTYIFLAIA